MESYLRELSIMIVPLLMAVTFHEVAHGWVAYRLGDPTAKKAGRLTLNPFSHLDMMGTIVFLVTRMIGWAKPVPVNPMYFKNYRKGMLWVGLAGPATNLILAVVSAILYRLLHPAVVSGYEQITEPLTLMLKLSVSLNTGLAVFNLVPVPPLDGSRILTGLLPARHAALIDGLERYGFIILLILIFSGIVDYVIFPVIYLIVNILLLS